MDYILPLLSLSFLAIPTFLQIKKKKIVVDFKVGRYSLNSEKTEDLRLSFELSSIFLLNYHD